MSKKKNIPSLNGLDYYMNKSYKHLVRDIKDIQEEIFYVDKKAKKKAKRKAKGDYDKFLFYYNNDKERVKVRKRKLKAMEKEKSLDKMQVTINDIAPAVNLIARLVAALMLTILSVDAVKNTISKDTLKKIGNVYKVAMAVKI